MQRMQSIKAMLVLVSYDRKLTEKNYQKPAIQANEPKVSDMRSRFHPRDK